jgi:putative ABC transport system permease protein
MWAQLRIYAHLVFGEGVRSLARHTWRSLLTVLGITIGIAAVVCVVASGKAGSDRAEALLHDLGDNLVWVEAGSRNVAGVRTGNRGTTSLTVEDAEAIARDVPTIKLVSPQVDGTLLLSYGNRTWTTRYRGEGADYVDIKNWKVAEGESFTQLDVDAAASVCVLGKTVRAKLFGDSDPLGQEIRFPNHLTCLVIGVLAAKGQSGAWRGSRCSSAASAS